MATFKRLLTGRSRRDVLLAALIAVGAPVELSLRGGGTLLELAGASVAALAIATRSRAPLMSAGAIFGAVAVVAAAGRAPGQFHALLASLLFGAFSLGATTSDPRGLAGAVLGIGALWMAVLASSPPDAVLLDAASAATFVLVPFGLGRAMRGRELRLASSEERAKEIEREREQEVARATLEERSRIARELHDVIAHGVSVMVVQASAAEQVLGRDPERARAPLLAIQETGRQALADLRRMLGLVREGDPALLTPRPGLDLLEGLAAQVRSAGLPVEVRFVGQRLVLPPGVAVSAYRIVQEALTNALKHAGPAQARVTVTYASDGVELEVIDDGRGPQNGSGQGLVGMRERVALYGGRIETGPAGTRGFRVRAWLPLSSGE